MRLKIRCDRESEKFCKFFWNLEHLQQLGKSTWYSYYFCKNSKTLLQRLGIFLNLLKGVPACLYIRAREGLRIRDFGRRVSLPRARNSLPRPRRPRVSLPRPHDARQSPSCADRSLLARDRSPVRRRISTTKKTHKSSSARRANRPPSR